MYHSQLPWAGLFDAILKYRGEDAYNEILEIWLENNPDECRWVVDFHGRTIGNWSAASDEDICHLYAIFRVTSLLLLRFQTGRADGTDYQGPGISVEGFQLFHEQLGFSVSHVRAFHPFFHEIITVTQSPNPDAPAQIDWYDWPCLMLGHMMFCRAGCRITVGSSYVIKGIAESSKLYWTYRRKDRPYNDQSHGWGHNSQWRTRLRRDYQSVDAYHFNVDGKISLNKCASIDDNLPIPTMIELVRNRCVVKSQIDDSDLCPYLFNYTEES